MTLRADQIIRRLVSANYSSVVLERFGFLEMGIETPVPPGQRTNEHMRLIDADGVMISVYQTSMVNFGGAIVSSGLDKRPYVTVVANRDGSCMKFGVVLDGSRSVSHIVDEIHRIIEGE